MPYKNQTWIKGYGRSAQPTKQLREATLFGDTDAVDRAMARLREFEPPEGYYVAFSGGKDSQAVLELAKQSGVKYDAHMNLTTVDAPELLRFIRANYPDVTLERPGRSMYQLIIDHRWPPTRVARYCCAELKERADVSRDRLIVTGIRAAESTKRKHRRMVEVCKYGSGRRFLHPIIDWSDDMVWEYLGERGLAHCSLYDEGLHRMGCVMCPVAGPERMAQEAARWPKFAAMYRRACRASFDRANADKPGRYSWKNGDEMYEWWLTGRKMNGNDAGDHPPLFFTD